MYPAQSYCVSWSTVRTYPSRYDSMPIYYLLEPKLIVERLVELFIYGGYKEFPDLFLQELISWIDIMGKGSLRIHCTDKHFHYGRRIILREITNYNETKENIPNADQGQQFKNGIELINKLFEEEEGENV